MALYRTIQKNKGLAYDEEAFAPSTLDYLTATSEQTWIDSSFSSGARIDELNRANGEQAQIFVGQGMGFQPLAESATEPVRMSVEAQTKRIDEAGLSSYLKAEEGFTPEALDIVIERKKEELVRQTTLSYDMPWYVDAMAFGVEFGTAMLDPINIASAFVPVIGEARALGMLTRAGKQGALALAKQRAKIGLIEGTVGAAMVEPLTYYAHDQEQADYDMYDSLVNVLSGGVFGATLQPSFGAIGDVIRKKRGGRAPWEMLSPTEESEQLRQGFIDQAYTAYIAANPNGKREEIVAAASLFDARARAHAYDVGSGETGVHDYYAKHMPRFEKGNVGEGLADGALGQPLNEGVDIETPVEVVAVQPRFAGQNPKVLRKRFPNDVKVAVLDAFKNGVVNEDTGKTLSLSGKDFKEHLKFEDHEDGLANLEAIQALPELARTSKLVESYDDKKDNPSIKKMHRYQGALRIGDKDYSVKLTVKEFKDGTLALAGDNPIKLYHHRLEKEMPTGNSYTLQEELDVNRPSAGISHEVPTGTSYTLQDELDVNRPSASIHSYTLRELLESVKDSQGDMFDTFFQSSPSEQDPRGAISQDPRGAVSFDADGRAVIKFFSHADASTLPHELFHVFRREMMESVQDANATPAMKERYGIIEDFVGAKSGEAWTPEMEEKFATAAERYFLEGVAPSPELKGVFAKLKQWLTEIYTSLELNKIPISDNMRKVFGEMLVPNFTESDLLFRKQMGEMLSYDSLMARASEYDRGNEANFDVDSNQGAALDDGIAAATEAFDRWQHVISMKNPKIAENAENLKTAILKEADDELKHLEVRREMEIDAIACELGH